MRRGTIPGLLGGMLALTLLEAFLSGPQTTNVGGLLRGVGALARRWSDPTVPAIPDLRGDSAPQTSAQPSSSTSSTTPRLPSTVTV